ncbi:uncharacterized protein BYT42DRAFT_561761 [Radiomyces spectabilis]|uniref:uncharacterized protein n=1 Tax=Radiomyces spectabilis TaxID=64574 RepID=UPI0022204E78|nr:uncharacterized protein BYT42DRAFT_561761 [Radiomyces spectabilis]KAI8384221.1 hypothetical protein BYT42DRAFT_561761 [Radiomyces spectabilis]
MAKTKKRTKANGHGNSSCGHYQTFGNTQMPAPKCKSSFASEPLIPFFNQSQNVSYTHISDTQDNVMFGSGFSTELSSPTYYHQNSLKKDDNFLINIHTTEIPASMPLDLPLDQSSSDVSRQVSIEEDVCFPSQDDRSKETIDFDALEKLVAKEQHYDYHDITPRRRIPRALSTPRFHHYYDENMKYVEAEDSDDYRIAFYSPAEPTTIHARTLTEIPSIAGESFTDMLKKAYFWIDILSPTDAEMQSLSKIFHIHPLTAEDIATEEPREKCEVFKNYCFVCFRTFDQNPYSTNYLQPISLYIIILKEGILTFHFRPTPHPQNVRKRIKQLKDYINVTPDWICYGLLDDITDSFAPLIRAIEFEVDSIDELVLILKESEQSDMLRRIGYCRKRMMGILRLLVSKPDVVKTIIKRGELRSSDGSRSTITTDVVLYLGDVQDHLLTMLQSLNHYEKISSRSHSNYLAQISIEMTQTNNEINDVLSKLTALGSVLIPMNLVTGLWGMNVQVPGQYQEDLTWFTCIMCAILTFCVTSIMLMRFYNIV